VAADILTSSIKLAEAFVTIKEEPKPVEEEKTEDPEATAASTTSIEQISNDDTK